VTELAPGIAVRHVIAGPLEGLTKAELPGQLCTFAREVLRTEATFAPGYYDVIHSHYWLSGQVGALARDRWGVPLVHSMHTMAKVKNGSLAAGDPAEPAARIIGEEQVVEAADLIVANTNEEARELVELYGAQAGRVRVITPGVNLDMFQSGDKQAARRRLGMRPDAFAVMFAGRIQPLKAPDVVINAAADLVNRRPSLRDTLVVPVIGGPSGSGLETPRGLLDLAASLGVADIVRFVPPVEQSALVDYYQAASLVVVPSYNESFGLVAIEAQACGTPVVAANVGGLTTAIVDGRTGVLVDGHDPKDYADVIARLLDDDATRVSMGLAGADHARQFGWEVTARRTLEGYSAATDLMRAEALAIAT
jgi:D-inositol-3-phosphate glycosyltransferase